MPVSALGAGSGLDLSGLVAGLVNAEGSGRKAILDQREFDVQTDISAFGTFKASLSEFNSAIDALGDISQFQARTATSSDNSSFTVSASTSAAATSVDIDVVAVATAHTLTSLSETSTNIHIGGGSLTIALGSDSFTMEIASGASTLNDIRDAINGDSDNVGVTASVINTDSGAQLILTSNKLGTVNAITVTTDDDDENDTDTSGLSRLVNMTSTAAVDGQITVNSQLVTNTSGNTYTDVIEGVTINALEVTEETEKLTVALDTGAVKSSVKDFIEAYNTLKSSITELTSYNAGTGQSSALQGDALVRGVSSQIYSLLTSQIEGIDNDKDTLTEMGVGFSSSGDLVLDDALFDAALDDNFNDIGLFFAGSGTAIGQQHTLGSTTFAATSTVVGDGDLTIAVGDTSFTVTITNGSNDSVQGIADTINNATDNAGVTASVVAVSGGYQLLLSSDAKGADTELTITVAGDGDGDNEDTSGLSQLVYDTESLITNLTEEQSSTRTGVTGIASDISDLLDNYLGFQGILTQKTETLDNQLQSITDDRIQLSDYIIKFEAELTARFSALDSLVAQLNTTGSFLSTQLDNLNSLVTGQNK
ncbi:MAG: flagellar filament capping protein FliD [Pseudomonadales bacterium]|nr:flagellar filament capping protein FliD [Pseudomonadales bacterium]